MSKVIGTGSLSGYTEEDFEAELYDIIQLRGNVNTDLPQLYEHTTLLWLSCTCDVMADKIYAVMYELEKRIEIMMRFE